MTNSYTNRNDGKVHYMTWINNNSVDKMVMNSDVSTYVNSNGWVNKSIIDKWSTYRKKKDLLINDPSILELIK